MNEPWKFEVPKGWDVIRKWGEGWALRKGGLRVIVDCETKADGHEWIHVSCSRKNWTPTHAHMCEVKADFIGDRYAYAVYPPEAKYLNIHAYCLHLWARADGLPVLPEFSTVVEGVGLSI